MSFFSDLRILYHLTMKPVRGKDHASRLENFYSGQAHGYDDFRKRLLQGRQEMWDAVDAPPGAVWVDMGGGTGSNLEYFGERRAAMKKIYVVDLSRSLLEVARQRIEEKNWTNIETVEADATAFQPPEAPVDVVTFSYSLTMIPDWFAAIENALAMLKPGGLIGVSDFYVSRKYPSDGLKRHGWFSRSFWPVWFASDNVFPSTDHAPFLHRHFEPVHFEEKQAKVPYIPFLRAPYYVFVGRKANGPAIMNEATENKISF
ncbi:class I SAM-dependent methyltransferase [Lignipirellula cremea]|uniref:Ubiquinone/menaquinone biosynthesis C-methyltransferase UbiE n=1 Tax=Lignipirellula cremea TaxID=2528010 RepID=A0A518E044_9BACT|nr:class I SAM-dependent methyltransferase [Lignipirellula cremea]QDU97457.1 Ubiquinone/menaquinone biosynthesis C-methyltransferase UbiE [Lignipirellula cremea]